jgi:hypothetical protein
MAQLSSVTLNQVPYSAATGDVAVDGFDEVYGSLRSASPTEGPSARPSALPPVSSAQAPNYDAEPRLDLRTSAERGGTRIEATLTSDEAAPPTRVSLFIDDVSAENVTQALSDILDAQSATGALGMTDPELADQLLAQLRVLLEDLAALFPGLNLDFFGTLPSAPDLPDLDQYQFIDIYDHRLWQMAWSNWDGGNGYSVEDMFRLSLQSATLSSLSLSFNSDIIDAMTNQQNGVRQ